MHPPGLIQLAGSALNRVLDRAIEPRDQDLVLSDVACIVTLGGPEYHAFDVSIQLQRTLRQGQLDEEELLG